MHSHDLIAQGVPVSKLLLVSAWHEAGDIFDMRERGVLAWTETVTDVARTGVPDDAYAAALAIFSEKELADLTVAVGVMGAYNRLAISFHQRPAARKGEYPPTLLQGRFRAVTVENLLPMLTTFDQDVESR